MVATATVFTVVSVYYSGALAYSHYGMGMAPVMSYVLLMAPSFLINLTSIVAHFVLFSLVYSCAASMFVILIVFQYSMTFPNYIMKHCHC